MISDNYKLQFITHSNELYSYADSARIALEGGCRLVQFRMKDADAALLEETAISVQQMCKEHGATFIIDDDVLLAKKLMADGVHLGKNDTPIDEARRILGDGYIIGGTVNTYEDIEHAVQTAMPDYFGCGPFRFTSTKKNLAPILGYEGYRCIIEKMRDGNIDIPLVAIGGICNDDITGLLQCGVDGIALSGSVLRAANPIEEMKSIVNNVLLFNNNKF